MTTIPPDLTLLGLDKIEASLRENAIQRRRLLDARELLLSRAASSPSGPPGVAPPGNVRRDPSGAGVGAGSS